MRRVLLLPVLTVLCLSSIAGAGKARAESSRGAAEPSAEQGSQGFVLFRRSVLERVYQDSEPRPAEAVSSVRIQATLGEYEPVQLAVYPLRDLRSMEVSVSDLTDAAGHVLPSKEIGVRMVRYYNRPLAMEVKNRFAVVPKTLEVAQPISVPKQETRPFWITVHVPEIQPGGEYHGTIHFKHREGEATLPLTVEVVPLRLQEPDVLFGPICIGLVANLWKTLPNDTGETGDSLLGKAERQRTILEHADLIFRDLREHGMNTISLRSASAYREKDGHPYLPELEAAIDAYHRYGFTQPMVYCLGYLLKTNKIERSSNYRDFKSDVHLPMARRVTEYYTGRFREEGLPGIVFMPVEEPNRKKGVARSDPPDSRSKLARPMNQAVKEAGGATAMTCTPESITFGGGFVDHWIAAYKKFSPTLYDNAAKSHARLGLYANGTLMSQGTYFTRFFFGYFIWANDLHSIMPWTYPLTPKRFPRNHQNRGEGGLQVHDGFIGTDGKPITTIQWELAREGIDDAKYMVTVERLAKAARAAGSPEATAAADRADRFLAGVRKDIARDPRHYTFTDPRTYEPEPQDAWDATHFEQTRAEAVEILKQLLRYPQSDPNRKEPFTTKDAKSTTDSPS